MDPSFLGFLGTVAALGIAFSVPVAFLMYVRARTRPPEIAAKSSPVEFDSVLRDHQGQLEDAVRRIGELEERLDFTERLLAQHRQPSLPGEGGH